MRVRARLCVSNYYEFNLNINIATDSSYADCISIECGSAHTLLVSADDGRSDSDSLCSQIR